MALLEQEHRNLQQAHDLIQRQNKQIEAVEELGRTLIKEVEVDRIGATVKDILLQRVRFEAMAFYVRSPDSEGLGLVSFGVDAPGAFVPEATWEPESEERRRLVERCAGLSVVELFSEEGQLVGGVLGLPRSDGGTDVSLFNALLPHLTIAAKHGHAFATIRGFNRDLEKRVEERTKELTGARDLLSRSVEQLKESSAARTRLFSNLNHEFRTPLTLILMPLERLISLPELEAHRSRLQSMELNARKLLQLVNGLLDLAASTEGRLRLKLADLDLAQLARRSLAAFEPAAEQIGITLGLDATKPVMLHASPDAVSRIIDNLLGNAIKYTRPGGRIDLRVEGGADTVRLEVRDTGVGIAPEHHDRIFERFERVSEPVVAGASGTGIGLALVRELCRWHGGSIGVVSALGQGSTFEVTLPRRPPPETLARIDRREVRASDDRILRRRDDQGMDLPGEKRAPPSLSLTLALGSSPRPPIPEDDGRPTILVVEDNPQLRAQLREVLHSHFRVLEAESGVRALELATVERLDLVVSDLVMPGMDGLQFCAAFKKTPGHEIVPFILLTAMNDRAVLVSAIEQGADDFLVKPFNEGELLARVRAQLRIRDLARRLSMEQGQGLVGPALDAATQPRPNPNG